MKQLKIKTVNLLFKLTRTVEQERTYVHSLYNSGISDNEHSKIGSSLYKEHSWRSQDIFSLSSKEDNLLTKDEKTVPKYLVFRGSPLVLKFLFRKYIIVICSTC